MTAAVSSERRCIGAAGRPCAYGAEGRPCDLRGVFGRRCAPCHRRHLRARAREDAVIEMLELRGVPCPRPEPERRDGDEQPERYEDPDGTPWEPFAG